MIVYPNITSLDSVDIEQYPVKTFTGKIHIVDNEEKMEYALHYLRECEVIGFDTETRPSFKKGVSYSISLLQLSDSNEAFLFRLHDIGLPKGLLYILSSEHIIKAGAAIHDDIKSLKAIAKFKTDSFVDVQTIAKDLGIEHFSLKKLCPLVLGFRISKRQQLSNWELPELSDAQKAYAATDAWVSYELYKALKPFTT